MRATQWEAIIPRGGRAKTSQERISVFGREMSEMTAYFIGTAMRISHLTALIFRSRRGELKIIDCGIRYEITEGPCKGITEKIQGQGNAEVCSICIDYFLDIPCQDT